MKPLSMFFLSASFVLGLALSSCAAFSRDDLNQSALKKHYDPPVIKISPSPAEPITALQADIFIDVEHLGGLSSITYQSDSGLETHNASSSTTYRTKKSISSMVSRTFPITVTAHSAKTGISSTTNVEFILFAGSVVGPPLITISEPLPGRLLAPGAITIRGSAHHPIANIRSLTTERAGSAPVSHPVPTPSPAKYDFTQIENVVAGTTLNMSITATSTAGISDTTNITWRVVDIPEIISISPPSIGTTINTSLTNFSVVVLSPHANTTVNLYWNNILKDTLTTDGSGMPLVFSNISIPLLPAAAPIDNATLRIQASYPSGRTANQDYTFRVDHTLALVPPVITFLNPDPSIPFRTTSFNFETRIEQTNSGIKTVTFNRTSPPITTRTSNIPAVPLRTNYYFSENLPFSPYAGSHSYRITAISHADSTNISNFTYTLVGPTNTITLSSNSTTWQAFNFSVTSDTNIGYVLISTNTGGNSSWRNIAAYVPNTDTHNAHHLIPLPFNSTMGVRLTSFDSYGIIVTNSITNTFATHSDAFVSTVFPPRSSNIPHTGGVPFTATVLSPVGINHVELKVNGTTVFLNGALTGGNASYTFNVDIASDLVLGNNQVELLVNRNPVTGSPIEYQSVGPGGVNIFASYPQNNTVVTSTNIRISLQNWGGSVQLTAGRSTITKLSSGQSETIPSTINPGSSYTQSAAQAFDLDIGENRFRIRLENGALSREDEIVIYRHNNTNY